MLKFFCLAVVLQVCLSARLARQTVIDQGTHLLICKQEPIDLAIVLDSSSSIHIRDFRKGIAFLGDFLDQFQIGPNRNDVRVAIIPYGYGIYKQHAFNLDSYSQKQGVLDAIARIKHEQGLRTDTGNAIQYMYKEQMSEAQRRPWADHIAIVITDGNSQLTRFTKEQSALARESGIKMFAVGVGERVKQTELVNIAGDESRVTRVASYDDLDSIKEILAKRTCIKKEKPTTTPKPPTEEDCARENPSDINFVFSPEDLGTDATSWATNIIYLLAAHHNFSQGFRYGAVSGSCPEDEGFPLGAYIGEGKREALLERLNRYERYRLPELMQRAEEEGYQTDAGGRPNAQNVAVVVVDGSLDNHEVEEQMIEEMVAEGIEVYVVDPYDSGLEFPGATTMHGTSPRDVAEGLVHALCHWE